MTSRCWRKISSALGLALLAALLVPTLAFAAEGVDTPEGGTTDFDPAAEYSDVVAGSWYVDGVTFCATNDLMTGYTEGPDAGKFGVGRTLTRAELASILWRVAEPEAAGTYAKDADNATGMPDVADRAWYTGAANWAVKAGVIHGFDVANGVEFRPNDPVTTEQLATILANYADPAGAEAADQSVLAGFADEGAISDWARASVAWAKAKDIVNGYDEQGVRYLKPAQEIPRERVAVVLANAFEGGVISFTTHTVSFDACGVDCTIDSQTVRDFSTATQPDVPANNDYEFVGWYTDKGYTQAFDFSTRITSDLVLYAKWNVKGYWLAAAGAQDPTASVIKTLSQIDADVAAIKSGDATVIAEYSKYLADDSVHLYTRWTGSTTDASEEAQDANKYVEFRVVQVGTHDKEGCNITFQATHLLPEAASMNSKETNTGGWGATELHASMQEGGAIYKNFDSAFTDKILTVGKASSKGDMSTELVYSQDKFWLLSFSEYTGVGVKDFAAFEGSQYTYWADKGVTHDGEQKWECLKFSTRAGNNPANLQRDMLRCWERSPLLNEKWPGSFAEIYCPEKTGKPGYGTTADYELGVILAFCF